MNYADAFLCQHVEIDHSVSVHLLHEGQYAFPKAFRRCFSKASRKAYESGARGSNQRQGKSLYQKAIGMRG